MLPLDKLNQVYSMLEKYKDDLSKEEIREVMRKKGYDQETIQVLMKRLYPENDSRSRDDEVVESNRIDSAIIEPEAHFIKHAKKGFAEDLKDTFSNLGKHVKLFLALALSAILALLAFSWYFGLISF